MIRKRFSHSMDSLCSDLFQLGTTVEEALQRAIYSMKNHNPTIALWVLQQLPEIEETRRTLEERAILLLATQQPIVARDLRIVITLFPIALALEATGQHAYRIAQHANEMITRKTQLLISPDIDRLITLVWQMLHTSLTAFLDQHAETARSIVPASREVATLALQLRQELPGAITTDPACAWSATATLDVVAALADTATQAVAICERVVYIETNRLEKLDPWHR